MIDIHTHLGRWPLVDEPDLTEAELLRQLDALEIERAVVLPLEMTPECPIFSPSTEGVLAVYRRHPDRIIPFANLDPRFTNSPKANFSRILGPWKEAGCKGLGELTANMWFDDPLCQNLYHHCGEVGLPVTFHLAVDVAHGLYGVADDLGMPRLERTLQQFPNTVFIGHAMAFWAEVAADATEATRGGYPEGPVRKEGRTVELLRRYPNLYGDLSAGSGFNAISRDSDFGYRFLEELQDKLLFGTDICHANQECPIVGWFRDARKHGKISQACYEKIGWQNATRLLAL